MFRGMRACTQRAMNIFIKRCTFRNGKMFIMNWFINELIHVAVFVCVWWRQHHWLHLTNMHMTVYSGSHGIHIVAICNLICIYSSQHMRVVSISVHNSHRLTRTFPIIVRISQNDIFINLFGVHQRSAFFACAQANEPRFMFTTLTLRAYAPMKPGIHGTISSSNEPKRRRGKKMHAQMKLISNAKIPKIIDRPIFDTEISVQNFWAETGAQHVIR